MVKNLPAMQETQVQSLGWEDPVEKEMVTHSSILALENSMDRRAWWATIHGVAKRVGHDSVTCTFTLGACGLCCLTIPPPWLPGSALRGSSH